MITLKYRIKDSTSKRLLNKMASDVNFVWNYCNEFSRRRWKESRKYTSAFDLNYKFKGASKEMNIDAKSIQAIGKEFATRQRQFKKQLRWRSYKRSLGWIPFNGHAIMEVLIQEE